MTDLPGVDGGKATASQARTEALAIARRIASGGMDSAETAVALADLDKLVNANIVDFPPASRPALTQDIQSARAALNAKDRPGLREAARSIQDRLLAAAPAAAAQ